MGSVNFDVVGHGKTAKTAFNQARKEALHYHGHGGYTGTIAEKDTFKEVKLSPEVIADKKLFWAKINELLDSEDFEDKWGPAGCVKIADGEFFFFGWASE